MTAINFTQTLNLDAGANNGLTTVMRFETSVLTLPSGVISQMQFTFEAGAAEALTITNAYVGHQAGSGDLYDFAATPVQILFGGSGSVAISAGQTALGVATFAYNKTSNLLVAFYTGGGVSVDTFRYRTGLAGVDYYYKTANDAATVNKTGYSTVADLLAAINKIESDGDFRPQPIFF